MNVYTDRLFSKILLLRPITFWAIHSQAMVCLDLNSRFMAAPIHTLVHYFAKAMLKFIFESEVSVLMYSYFGVNVVLLYIVVSFGLNNLSTR